VKVALGTFACKGIKASLDSDLAAGVRTALADYAHRIESEAEPVGVPHFLLDSVEPAARSLDLVIDERTWTTLTREAARQGTTLSRLASHSVLVYLAELERLTPPGGTLA